MATAAIPPPNDPSPVASIVPASATMTQLTTNLPLPKIFTYHSTSPPQLIVQGAEALLYKSTYLLPSIACALKYRPSKPYRHPILDARLTKHRILSEARVLAKCRREGVPVPAVYALDEKDGWLMVEWVEGDVVRVKINEWLAFKKERGEGIDGEGEGEELLNLLGRMGTALGKMHSAGIIHGDLTTSNLMLRPHGNTVGNGASETKILNGEVVLIDFGLAAQSSADEDRAVDLYVLERAFGSTHPRAEGLFKELLVSYAKSYKGGKVVIKKLEDVRMRGRKRSMLG